MNFELRDPKIIMKLSRLGSFHQSRLSFLRSFLSEFKDWEYNQDLFNLDKKGFGTAVYSFKKKIEFTLWYVLQIKLMIKTDLTE